MAANNFDLLETVRIAGETYVRRTVIEGNGIIEVEDTLAAAKAGDLTTRTDDNTGTLTMDSGHGITTGSLLDVYWEGGCRRGMTVGTVATNSVPIDGGNGDNLPVVNTEITAMVPVVHNLLIDGDNVLGFAFYGQRRAAIDFLETASAYGFGVDVEEDNSDLSGGYIWDSASGVTNPLAGLDVVEVRMSHGDSGASRTVRVAIVY